MAPQACVEVPKLPLQMLLRLHPDWGEHPVAVVDRDKPGGAVLAVNQDARDRGIVPGMRYATTELAVVPRIYGLRSSIPGNWPLPGGAYWPALKHSVPA